MDYLTLTNIPSHDPPMMIMRDVPTRDDGMPPRERARSYATFLKVQLQRTDLGSERVMYFESEQLRLVQGKHRLYPNVRLTCAEVGIDPRYRNVKIPTNDAACTLRKRRISTRDFLPPEDIDLIFEALKNLCRRIDKLAGVEAPAFRAASQGPAMTPRALNPAEAYQAHLTASQMAQARASQRIAHEAMPDVIPQHPADAEKEAREQAEALRTDPHRDTTHDNATAYARALHNAAARKQLARPYLTFASQAKADTTDSAHAMRRHETDLVHEMQRQIATRYNKE